MSEVGVELLGRYRRVLEHPRPSPCSGSDADVGAELLRGLQMACEIFMHAEEFSPDSVVGGLRWDWTFISGWWGVFGYQGDFAHELVDTFGGC